MKIKEAKKFGVDPSASDIDQAYAGMSQRMRLSADQLTKSLESQGVRPETLKARLKAEMVWAVWCAAASRRASRSARRTWPTPPREGGEATQTDAFEYKLQPIVLIVPRGSAPAAVDLRRKEAEILRERVQTCEQANSLLQVDAERRDPRHRHQDVGRHSRGRCANCWTRRRSAI